MFLLSRSVFPQMGFGVTKSQVHIPICRIHNNSQSLQACFLEKQNVLIMCENQLVSNFHHWPLFSLRDKHTSPLRYFFLSFFFFHPKIQGILNFILIRPLFSILSGSTFAQDLTTISDLQSKHPQNLFLASPSVCLQIHFSALWLIPLISLSVHSLSLKLCLISCLTLISSTSFQ